MGNCRDSICSTANDVGLHLVLEQRSEVFRDKFRYTLHRYLHIYVIQGRAQHAPKTQIHSINNPGIFSGTVATQLLLHQTIEELHAATELASFLLNVKGPHTFLHIISRRHQATTSTITPSPWLRSLQAPLRPSRSLRPVSKLLLLRPWRGQHSP